MTHVSQSNTDIQESGLIVVFSAPSGAGKTSVLHEILKLHPEYVLSISVTTREPRGSEQNGIDYRFVSDGEFNTFIQNSAFIEWAVVHGFRYGTLKSSIEKAMIEGKTIIMDTDTVGAFNIKIQYPHAILIFIVPPSPDELFKRLENRKTETPDKQKKRQSAAPKEVAQMSKYDYIVVNDILADVVKQVDAIITAESLKSAKVIPKLSSWRNYIDEYFPANRSD